MTVPANCKKTNRHHAHLSLCTKSRKPNNAMWIKWPKSSIWAIFDNFNCKLQFFLKNRFYSKWRTKTKKIVATVFEKNISVWFWAILETFSRISPNQEFFSKLRFCHFSTFIVPVSEKTALPTNQPIITNNTNFIGPHWRRSKKIIKSKWQWEKSLKSI